MITKPLEIFKRGRHVASNGVAIDFTEAHLAASAAAYDPAKHEAPIVVGHPRHDAPAYGWVKAVNFADPALNAEPHQVDAQFAEMVSAGRFKKISASFYTPDAPNNPVPGVYYLRHVGFLGAQPPAVKGLKSVDFADVDAGVIEFADWADMQNASLWRRLRDWLIGEKGLDAADKIIPDYAVASLEDDARSEPDDSAAMPAANYHENAKEQNMTAVQTAEQIALAAREAQIKADREALDARTAEFNERETRIKAAEIATRRKATADFVAGLVTAGTLLPRDQAGLVAYMCGPNESGVIEFGEGDAKVSKPADEWFREFLTALPKQVDYQERSAGPVVEQTTDARTIADRALEFQEAERKAGRTVTITAAVTHVTAAQQ